MLTMNKLIPVLNQEWFVGRVEDPQNKNRLGAFSGRKFRWRMATLTAGLRGATGQRSGLLSRRLQVRVLPGALR